MSGQGAMLSGTFKVAKVGKRAGPRRAATSTTTSTPAIPTGRIPRIARLMALAIKLDAMIRSGEITNQRQLAAVACVTPARVSQIMNLLHLSPQIQEQLLFLPLVTRGKDAITERELRHIITIVCWREQDLALSVPVDKMSHLLA
ncbi:MAG TPA: hypothetical protein VK157_03215 [Phycisphaerales bacterium]|nr:hypothetical protein [Phycisphaerales bacterium]